MSEHQSGWLLRWLEGSYSDRERFQGLQDRLRKGWLVGVLISICSVLTADRYGWWLACLPAQALVGMALGIEVGKRSRHAEVVAASTFLMLETNMAVFVLFTGGGLSPMLGFMVVPVFSQAVAFRRQVTAVWALLSGLIALAVIVGASWIEVPSSSPLLGATCYLALLACLAVTAYDLAEADVLSRDKAAQDALTGLLNRKTLDSRFARLAARLRVDDQPLALLMIDVDHFKRINDTHGHHRGDLVLRDLAQRLQVCVRPTDLVFRVGGEEFLVLMPGLNQDTARFAADRLSRAVSDYPVADLTVTVSVGLASGRGEKLVYDRMVAAADAALYRAKQDGRNCVRNAA